jgi:hypothetical protein
MDMKLTLRDVVFPIKKPLLYGSVWDSTFDGKGTPTLFWAIEIEVEDRKFFDYPLTLSFDYIKFSAQRWTELIGNSVDFTEPYDDDGIKPRAYSYVTSHNPVPRANLQILERDGGEFSILWKGILNPYGDRHYNNWFNEMPFSIEAQVTFMGINVMAYEQDTEQTVRERLTSCIALDNLVQQPIESIVNVPGRYECDFKPQL